MTIGSAACLPRFEFFRPATPAVAVSPGLPPAGRRLALASSDPPHARILVVEPQAVVALDLQRILREAGYRIVGPATSADEVAPLLRRRRIDCAVIDLDTEAAELPAVTRLLEDAGVPFVVLGATVGKPYPPRRLLEMIEEAMAGDTDALPPPPSASVPRVPWPRVFPSL